MEVEDGFRGISVFIGRIDVVGWSFIEHLTPAGG